MSDNYKQLNNIDCDCECTIENALYFNQCAVRPDQIDEPELKFVPTPNIIKAAIPDEVSSKSDLDSLRETVADQTKKTVIDFAERLVLEGAKILKNKVTNFADRNGGNNIIDIILPPTGGGGGKGNDNDPRSPFYRGSGFRLSYDPKPVEVRLNTGIKPKTYSSIYEDSVSNFSSPLHITLVKYSIPSDSSRIDVYFSKVLNFIFTNALQQAVTFNLDLTVFTPANIKAAINAIFDALQVYYWYNSIITFTENTENRNEGMLKLRSDLTADDLTNLLNLKRILLGVPIPPNLITFVFYLSQTFQFNDVPGSPLYKICPVTWDNTNNRPDSSKIDEVATSLLSDTNKKIFSGLSRCAPNWLGQTLPDIAWSPLYDPNFNTIWTNLPGHFTQNSGTTTYRVPTVSNASPNAKYVSYTNNLDGAAFALTSLYNSDLAAWSPSFVTVHYKTYSTTYQTNRLFLSSTGTWSDSCTNFTHALQRQESGFINTNLTGITATSHLAGSQICQNVTKEAISETTLQLLDYLMSLGTIGRLTDNRQYLGKAYFEVSPPKRQGSSGPKRGSRSKKSKPSKGQSSKGE